MLGEDENTWSPFPLEDLGEDENTWSPFPLEDDP